MMPHLRLYKRHQKPRCRISAGFSAFYFQLSRLNWFEDFQRLDSLLCMFKALMKGTSLLFIAAPIPIKVRDWLKNNIDGDITMPLSLKTIGSAGYRDQ